MTDPSILWYLEVMGSEIDKLKDSRFTGNINFKMNFREGGICNIDIGLNKSVKMEAWVSANNNI